MIYFIIVLTQDMSMDMVSGDTPERPVMNSIIKVCYKGGNGLL